MTVWPTIRREDYLTMLDRHWPFWAGLAQFIFENRVRSIVEVGCGVGHLCNLVGEYIGIDTNEKVIRENKANYGRGHWINSDWRDVWPITADLFVSSSVIEHCESFEPLLKWAAGLEVLYSVVTFHKGLRETQNIRPDKNPLFFDNHYSRVSLEKWLRHNVGFQWRIFDIPLSRAHLRRRWDSVLVIDRTGNADLSMWEAREIR